MSLCKDCKHNEIICNKMNQHLIVDCTMHTPKKSCDKCKNYDEKDILKIYEDYKILKAEKKCIQTLYDEVCKDWDSKDKENKELKEKIKEIDKGEKCQDCIHFYDGQCYNDIYYYCKYIHRKDKACKNFKWLG